jgi:multicomponent Na+:H+ antiporter subunit C
MEAFNGYILDRGPYLLVVLITVLGTYLMVSHRNYLKAIIGLYFFQTAVILFFIALGFRVDGTVPIIEEGSVQPMHNPLPHAMMLTAIVVGVAILGVGMSILRRVQDEAGSIEEHHPTSGPA